MAKSSMVGARVRQDWQQQIQEIAAAGYYLASKGHDTRAIQAYLGHGNVQHTVRYTELAPGRFNDFWKD